MTDLAGSAAHYYWALPLPNKGYGRSGAFYRDWVNRSYACSSQETPRDRIASYDEGKALLSALEPYDRTAYALALFAGLRNVERRYLDWTDIDFEASRLKVRISKSEAGIRTMPIPAPLKTILRAEYMRQGRPASGLVCRGPKRGAPEYGRQIARAKRTWREAGLEPIGFHECRHTFISTMIASGLNAKAVSVLAGHASIAVTFDRYGHLFAGHEDEAGRLLDNFYSGVADAEREPDEGEEASSSGV